MAIYHCSCKIVSRSNGRSSVGASAYRSGEKLVNEYDGIIHDYTHKQGVVYTEIMLPENAPEEWQDRNTLWNEVEKAEKGQNSQLAREYEIALPKELTREQQIECARNFAGINFVTEGMCVDIAIHDKGDGNPHAHIMTTMRPIDENGKWQSKSEKLYLCKNANGEERALRPKEIENNSEWQKQYYYSKNGSPKGKVFLTEYEKNNNPKYKDYERVKDRKYKDAKDIKRKNSIVERWDSKEFLQGVRASLSEEINLSLEQHGHSEKVDHRSYKEQGIDLLPTVHLGKSVSEMERRGIETDRGNINREVKSKNATIHNINKELRSIKVEQITVHTDMQIQNIHNNMELAKAEIPKANEQQIKAIEKNVLGAKESIQNFNNIKELDRVYIKQANNSQIKYMKYHTALFEEKSKAILEQCKARIEELKKVPAEEKQAPKEKDLQSIATELEAKRNDYINAQTEVHRSEKVMNQPRVIRDYEVAYNKIQYCMSEIEKNTAIYDKAKADREKLGAFKGKEKKALDTVMEKASSNIRTQQEILSKLGVSELKEAPRVLQELKAKDEKEKQVLKSFATSKTELKQRADELGRSYTELKESLTPQEQEIVSKLQEEIRASQPAEEKGNMTLERVQAEVKARELEPKAIAQERERIRTRERGGRGYE